MTTDRDEQRTAYVRQLEDALLILWAEMPTAEVKALRADVPELMAFCAHLHEHVEHEQAMVRVNVWTPRHGSTHPSKDGAR